MIALGTTTVTTDSVLYTLADGTSLRAAPAAEIVHTVAGRLTPTGIPLTLTRLPSYRPISLRALRDDQHPPYTHGIRLSGRGGMTYALITELP